jgi:multiple sugar transport system substrate-binding protein
MKALRYYAVFLLLIVVLPTISITSAQDNAPTQITLWHIIGASESEAVAFNDIVTQFNISQNEWEIVHTRVIQQTYDNAFHLAAEQDRLPCVVDVDAPLVPNYAWSGYLISLDDYISDELRADLLPTMLGSYNEHIYAVGYIEAALTLYGHRSVLEENNIRIPTGVDNPWTREEFDTALDTLAASGQFKYAIDFATGIPGEWPAYGLAPFLQSFGGDLINRDTYLTAEGILNGPEAIEWGNWWQSVFDRELADPNGFDINSFVTGDIPLMWNGSWFYPILADGVGDDLVIIPPPDMGHGPKIGAASWQWGISSSCEYPDGAWAFIDYLLSPENSAHLNKTTGTIPPRISIFDQTDFYGEGKPLNILTEFSREYAVIRPPTPGYSTIRDEFELVSREIANGADVEETLNAAVDNIDADIQAHDGYGFTD